MARTLLCLKLSLLGLPRELRVGGPSVVLNSIEHLQRGGTPFIDARGPGPLLVLSPTLQAPTKEGKPPDCCLGAWATVGPQRGQETGLSNWATETGTLGVRHLT